MTRDYLDRQLDEQTLKEQDAKLKSIGIDQNEFKKISEGLWYVFAMKQYRNPFYRLYGKGYYWKLMTIGLKGSEYKKYRKVAANNRLWQWLF